jgi:uncharacterized protein (DUF983 family)
MGIFKKGTKLYSILNYKCPRCHEGEVFKNSNPYALGDMFELHETCSHCGLRYEFEPGVFYGAMYVSYALTVALGVATYILGEIFFDPTVLQIVLALVVVLILGSPLILRLSRITWLNFFVKYEPQRRGANLK